MSVSLATIVVTVGAYLTQWAAHCRTDDGSPNEAIAEVSNG